VEFLDTNILVYAVSRHAADARKSTAARALVKPAGQFISLQVLQEFYRVATHPKKLGYTHAEAVRLCDAWRQTFAVLEPTLRLFDDSLAVCARYQTSYFDAAVIAAAALCGCTTLFSEDLNAGQIYGTVTIVNPFQGL
jgi:predicted nucleic acid-binding protein